ncbi:MAG: N-acetyl-gamma-glutamyl-phosphate reductase [Phycisphaerales bacterium]
MIRCAIVGAAGYAGAELLAILLNHPSVEVVGLFGSDKGAAAGGAGSGPGGTTAEPEIADLHPRFRSLCGLKVAAATPEAVGASGAEAVFLATPHLVSHDLAPVLLARGGGMKVFDLSASFRFKDAAVYPKHYGFAHAHAGLLARAVYGLPELFRAAIATADLVGVPGCYPTSAILALTPLVRAGAVDVSRRVIVDSISGVSGAGRSANVATLFCEVSVRPYEVLKHRHTPEIEAYSGTPVYFTPQVGPYERGIVSTIHVELAPGWSEARLREVYAGAYANDPFVRMLKPGTWPSVAGVQRTNFCDIALAVDEPNRHAIIVSAIDNLVKGAAGQAVQCMNIRMALDETTALRPGPTSEILTN